MSTGIVPMIVNEGTWESFVRHLMEQQTRLALEYMLASGWDIRQAPTALQLVASKEPGRTGDPDDTPLADYLKAQIMNVYSATNFDALKVNQQDYDRLLAGAEGSAKKTKK